MSVNCSVRSVLDGGSDASKIALHGPPPPCAESQRKPLLGARAGKRGAATPGSSGDFQAASSEDCRELAARIAEGVFTPQHTLAGAQDFYSDLKERMAKYGRMQEQLKIVPKLNPADGRTAKKAG
jgi:hypothetical protein